MISLPINMVKFFIGFFQLYKMFLIFYVVLQMKKNA